MWHPAPETVSKLRASIDERPHRWERTLMDPPFRQTFFPRLAKEGRGYNETKEAFAAMNARDALKTRPKGFNPSHRDMALLKLKSFTVSRTIRAEELARDDAGELVTRIVSAMVGFVSI